MISVIMITVDEHSILESYPTLEKAIKEVQTNWNEEERGPQCFVLQDSEDGKILATMARPNYDSEVCITTFLDTGRVVFERCHYLFRAEDGQERYTKTEVSLIRVVENW
jgi:hypothetical protein